MLYPRKSLPGNRRVVLTGTGIVTGFGSDWKANAEGFRSGRTAFRPVQRFDVQAQRVKTAAEADLPELPPTRLSSKHLARLDHAGKLLLVATHQAWQESGWRADGPIPFVLGTTAGGMLLGEAFFRQALAQPLCHRQQATRALFYQGQVQACAVADALGIDGQITIVSNACAAGANAIGQAWEWVRNGRCDRALAGGYEAITQLLFAGFDSLQALSPTQCRPFDARRDGLALGEGAAIVCLETLESASARNAIILAEIVGYGSTIDLHHLTQPHPQGEAAWRSMTLACESGRVNPSEIQYVNAHGTGTPLNDSSEAMAIQRWAGPHVSNLQVSSTKAGIGHLLGAAGAVEVIACAMALQEGFLPPELAFETPDPACAFPIVREPREAKLTTVLSNSFGFGGVNASLILRRWS